MNKLIVITTGGTIGSVLKGSTFSVEQSSRTVGCEIQAAAQALGLEVEVRSPINKNSESFAPTDWLDVLAAIDAADVDGVVVLHGTDTMEYTLAAACSFAPRWSKRVCFTGAMRSPDLPNSDARINLLAALSFAADAAYEDGVYLAFCDHADRLSASIFHASEVKPVAFDESGFHSVYGNVVARYAKQGGLQANSDYIKPAGPVVSGEVLPRKAALLASQGKVAYIKLYPGIDLHTLQALSAGRSVVVVELYHSGTGPASADYKDLIRLLEQHSDSTLFALSAFPLRTLQQPYVSTQAIMQAGGNVYADMQPHYLYVFCLLMTALGAGREEIQAQLSGSLLSTISSQ